MRIGRFPVQTPLVARPGLGTQPRYVAPGDLQLKYVKCSDLTLGEWSQRMSGPKLAVEQQITVKKKIGMQINIEVFYKLILSFWVFVARHAQSTQNKFSYLCNIFRKTLGMKLIFCLLINAKGFYQLIVSLWLCVARHTQSTQNNKFAIFKGKNDGWSWFFACR